MHMMNIYVKYKTDLNLHSEKYNHNLYRYGYNNNFTKFEFSFE